MVIDSTRISQAFDSDAHFLQQALITDLLNKSLGVTQLILT
jgi:hypothetical protein